MRSPLLALGVVLVVGCSTPAPSLVDAAAGDALVPTDADANAGDAAMALEVVAADAGADDGPPDDRGSADATVDDAAMDGALDAPADPRAGDRDGDGVRDDDDCDVTAPGPFDRHAGGDGSCVLRGTCAPGHALDADGVCRWSGACPDDGGACVRIAVSNHVRNASPERFGANLGGIETGSWTRDPGMEPFVLRYRLSASGGDSRSIACAEGPTTSVWSTLGDGFFDGARVRVYRFDATGAHLVRTARVARWRASAGSGHAVDLDADGPAVQRGDVFYVDLTPDNAPVDRVDPRMTWIPQWDTWANRTPGATYARDASQVRTGGASRTSIRLARGTPGDALLGQYVYYPPDDFGRALIEGRSYRVSFWARQEGIADGRVRFRLTQAYRSVDRSFVADATWRRFTFVFVAPPPPGIGAVVAENQVGFTGPGTAWFDDVVLSDASRDALTVAPDDARALADYHPGSVRLMSALAGWGTTFEDWAGPEGNQRVGWDTNNGRTALAPWMLSTALPLIEQAGGTPWLVASPSFDEDEWLAFIEYLAGPADSPWGARRAAQGHPRPFTDTFAKVRIEYGNESWNHLFAPWDDDATRYGQMAEHFFAVARSSPWFAAARDRIEFIVNGFVLSTASDGFGASARRSAPSASLVDITAYTGGWELGGTVGGAAVTAQGLQDTLLYLPLAQQPLFDAHATTRDALNAAGLATRVAVYEGGPSYDLPSPTNPSREVAEQYGKSLANAVSTLDAYLYGTWLDYGPQNFFAFGLGPNWTSHTSVVAGRRPHAAWLALSMRNTLATGPMVDATVLAAPTLDVAAHGSVVAHANVPLVSAYAFRDGSDATVFVLSRAMTGTAHGVVDLPFAPSGHATRTRLTGAPDATNRSALVVTPVASTVDARTTAMPFDLPASTIDAWVFHDVTDLVRADGPVPSVLRDAGQSATSARPVAHFAVHFDRPVVDLDAADLVVDGTAGARSAVLEAVPHGDGMHYRVTVQDVAGAGSITVTLRDGAVHDALGHASLAGRPALATVTFAPAPPTDRVVVLDGFDGGPASSPNPPFLDGVGGGFGWRSPWRAQNFVAASYVAGYALDTASPLAIASLGGSAAYARGGSRYTGADRGLDVDGALAPWAVWGATPSEVGQSGTTLWFSTVLRKDTDDRDGLWVGGFAGAFGWVLSEQRWGVGFFGADSVVGGTPRWSIALRDDAAGALRVATTASPVRVGEAVQLVASMAFGAVDTLRLWVSPSSPGAAPDATLTTTGGGELRFRTLGLFGGARATPQGSFDEIRFGDSMAAVTGRR